MARFAVLVSLLALFVGTLPAQTLLSSDPKAVSLASQSLAAMVGGSTVSDVTLTGSVIALSDTGSETGTLTFRSKVPGESRLDIRLASAATSAIRNEAAGAPQCALILGDGTKRQAALHNCRIDSTALWPALLLIPALKQGVLSYVGQEKRNGVLVEHLLVVPEGVAAKSLAIATFTQRLGMADVYLDATSFLPLGFVFNTHPDNDATYEIPVDIEMAGYQTFSGFLVPTHIQRIVQGSLALDISLLSAAFNTGLQDISFSF
jgi:hypothetical protein